MKRGEKCPLTIRLGVRGSVVGSPSGGLQGSAPPKMDFMHILGQKKNHLEHYFQYFWATSGPPNVAGPGKTFLPPPPPLDGPGYERRYIYGLFFIGLVLKTSLHLPTTRDVGRRPYDSAYCLVRRCGVIFTEREGENVLLSHLSVCLLVCHQDNSR